MLWLCRLNVCKTKVLMSFLDAVDRLRWHHKEIDSTAIEFFGAPDPEEAYQLAR